MADIYELLTPLFTYDNEAEKKQNNTKLTTETPPHPSTTAPAKSNKKTTNTKPKTTHKTDKGKASSKQPISKTIKSKNKSKTSSTKKVTAKNFLEKHNG